MSPLNDDLLVRTYPLLFADRNKSPVKTPMGCGFECGDGWFALLWRLGQVVEPILRYMTEDERKDICAAQVKEKFGTLRFYMNRSTPEIDGIISDAEYESSVTCERCGEPGKARKGSWIKTRCDKCAAEK